MPQSAPSARPLIHLRRALTPVRHESTAPPNLSPDSFGRKARLEIDPDYPIPPWRQPKPKLQTSTLEVDRPQLPSSFPRARDALVPRYRSNPAIKPGFASFVKYRIFRVPEPPRPSTELGFNVLTNPYRVQKTWPPILVQMTEREQFHYEKKFRRRLLAKTKSMRQGWDRGALLARRWAVGLAAFYFAFVSEPGETQRLPTDGLRYWLYGVLLSGPWPQPVLNWLGEQHEYYSKKHKRQWDPYNLDGWDQTRKVNSLPGRETPAINRPLPDPVKLAEY